MCVYGVCVCVCVCVWCVCMVCVVCVWCVCVYGVCVCMVCVCMVCVCMVCVCVCVCMVCVCVWCVWCVYGVYQLQERVASPRLTSHRYPVLPECLDPRELEDEEGDMGDEGSEGSGDEEGGAGVSRAIDHQLPLFVLPLYSLLSSEQQAKVGVRRWVKACVV